MFVGLQGGALFDKSLGAAFEKNIAHKTDDADYDDAKRDFFDHLLHILALGLPVLLLRLLLALLARVSNKFQILLTLERCRRQQLCRISNDFVDGVANGHCLLNVILPDKDLKQISVVSNKGSQDKR